MIEAPRAIMDRVFDPGLRVRSWVLKTPYDRWPTAAHDLEELAWTEAGQLGYRVGSRQFLVPAGHAIIVPAGVEHKSFFEPGTVSGSIWLGTERLRRLADSLGVKCPNDPSVIAGGRIARMGRLLLEDVEADSPGMDLAADTLSEAIAIEVLRANQYRAPEKLLAKDPRIKAAVAHIESCYADNLTIAKLCQTANMSRYHFGRLFKTQVGVSPYRYIVKRRIKKAASYLRGGSCNVTEAAIRVGITEFGRFSKMFRQEYGCSPSQYMRSAK